MITRRALIVAVPIVVLPIAMPSDPALGQSKRSGCELAVYWDGGYAGESWRTTDDQPSAGPHWDKQISSIIVISGIWDFYREEKYHGEVLTLPPGAYPYVGDHWNDKISSFRCVRSTP